jgi:DNA-binding response OmpR family regulator
MKKILIVEDDAILTSILTDHLTKEGFEVMKAKNGEEALASAFLNKPDLILLDILLPKVDGFAMLKELRKDKWGEHVPVIILTNLNSLADISKASEYMDGFQGYLIKSDWKIEDVIAKVRETLKV